MALILNKTSNSSLVILKLLIVLLRIELISSKFMLSFAVSKLGWFLTKLLTMTAGLSLSTKFLGFTFLQKLSPVLRLLVE
jgi:hypothetical protein